MNCYKTSRRISGGILFLVIFLVLNTGFVFSQTYKIMPLGNSLSKGIIIDDPGDISGYRDDLQALLDNEQVSYDFVGSQQDGGFADNEHEGHEGFTADMIRDNLSGWLAVNPDIVIIHAGTNDITKGQKIDSTVTEIESIVDQIGKNKKILLCSILPRWDASAKDDSTTLLNSKIKNLYYLKIGEGYKIYYVGTNEVFKSNGDWASSTYYSDGVHPSADGYNLMARAIYVSIMNAIKGNDPTVTDNFNRSTLGVTWKTDPEYAIQNKELVNTAENDWWDYIATYVGITNPNQVSIKWGVDTDSIGVLKGGIVMGMDAPDPNSDGYLIWRYGNLLTLYEVRDGEPFSNPPTGHIYQVAGQQPFPQAGDVFKVVMRIENDKHVFDCFLNGQPDGTLLDFGKRHGASGRFYAGVMLKGHEGEPYFNNVDDFTIYGQDDIEPPGRITNLVVSEYTTTTATLKWTAPGDDDMDGTATGYDIRYSEELITETNFYDADQVSSPPIPATAGTQEIFVVTGLQAATTYFFAVKAYDDVPNFALISNSPSITTKESNILVDNFNRLELGDNWNADPEFGIVNDEMANTAAEDSWNYVAAFNARANPTEVSFKWSETADIDGIERGGLALMLDAASPNASGYLAWCRPNSKKISLFTIENGEAATPVGEKAIDPTKIPQPGSVFKVAMITDEQGHHFIYYVNGDKVGEIIDGPTPLQGTASVLYAGVMLHGNRNNNLDNFTIVNVGGEPTRLNYITGDFQEGVVGKMLPDSMVVSVTDMNGIPVDNVLVNFKVTAGGGSVDLEPPDANIRVEAENGELAGTFKAGEDETAGGGAFVYNEGGDPLSGKLDMDFFVETEGTYVVWGRVKASEPGFQYYSYFVQVDGEPAISTSPPYVGVWDFYPNTDTWTWDLVSERDNGTPKNPSVDPVEFYLTTGLHRITVTQRYPSYCLLDKVLLTLKESGYTPNGKEEFPQYITNSRGEASAALTMGLVAGTENNTVEVTVPGYDLTNEPYLFKASGLPDVPTLMNASSQTTQTGKGGNPLPSPFEVSLTDQYGNIASGYDVLFEITVGNGVLSNGAQKDTVTTNAQGKASTVLSLGTESEQNQVRATFPGLSPVIFTGIATSGLAEQLLPVSGSGLSGTVNTVLPTPLKVRVVDNIGDPVAKHPVTFMVTEGGGSISLVTAMQTAEDNDKEEKRDRAATVAIPRTYASELIVTSDVDGYAQVNLKLGTIVGLNTVTVTSVKAGEDLDGSPIVFNASSIADVPGKLSEVSGNGQTGAAGMPLSDPFVVRVTDQYDNPVAGHAVVYAIKQGTGSLNPAGPWITDSNGETRVTLTLGSDEGVNNIVEASSEYDGTPLSSTIIFQATAGSVSDMELSGSQSFTGSAGWPLSDSLKVVVLDNFGNPVGGYPIFWESIGENPGTINGEYQTIASSDRNGISKVGFFASQVPGQVLQVIARADELNGSPVVFDINIANVDALQRITGNFQSGTVGSPLAAPFRVKVVDELNKAIPGYNVNFKVTAGNGNFSGDSTLDVITNENREADALLTLGPVPGINNNSVEVSAYRKGLELLEHGNLDDWSTSGAYPIGWGVWKSDASIDVRQEVANARSGKAVRFSIGPAGGSVDIYMAGDLLIKPSSLYEFSFWVKGAIAGKTISGYLKDDGGQFLKSDDTWSNNTAACITDLTTTSYKKHTIRFTTRSGVTKIPSTGIYVLVSGSNNICYVDDVSLIEVNAEGNRHVNGSPLTFTASAQIGQADSLAY
ncbi:MAG: GDSL-type esterase/lipase family protein, partial [candidate division KSB1 bacterium]|nr:GDSL-type esterase/lipase family protein [candidate division KSB1 bacterium]